MAETTDKLTLQEVVRDLGRSLEQVGRYVREGKLPADKLGMQWFVERRTLEALETRVGSVPRVDILERARAAGTDQEPRGQPGLS